jgi:hypothetical protein
LSMCRPRRADFFSTFPHNDNLRNAPPPETDLWRWP